MPHAQLSNVRLRYFERGHGPERVVFIHGFQASGRIWQLVQAELPVEQYHTIAIDNRGAGESEAPPNEADFSVPIFAADAFELVTQLGWRDFTLVGHSLGGPTVAQFAVDHGDLLKGLVLLDPADPNGRDVAPAEVERTINETIQRRRERQARDGGGDGLTDAGLGQSEFARALAADMAAAPERRLRGSMRSMLTLRLGDQLGRLTMPVLMACGDADEVIPIEAMLTTWGRFPKGAGLHVWHGVGHSPNVDIPDQVAAVLRHFIERTAPAMAARQPH